MNRFIRNPVCVPAEGDGGVYQHSFGGKLPDLVIPPGGKATCHLLYTIDTADPLFPIRLEGTRLLPLIYCQQYNAAAMSYRVIGASIVIDWIESSDWSSGFPYDDYPSDFPCRSIVLQPVDMESLRRQEEIDEDTRTNVSRFGGWHWLCQGIPTEECRNPECSGGRLDVFGVVYNEPVKGVYLWDPGEDWSDVEIIYQICSSCFSIQVCSRCT